MKNFCPLPWTHLQIEPNGECRACCHMPRTPDAILGNITTDPIDTIWNSDKMKELRRDILADKRNDLCSSCFTYEDAGIKSSRHAIIENLTPLVKNLETSIANTDADGNCPDVNLEYWDFKFSNICNLKCRSCGPHYSSSWQKDAFAMGLTDINTSKPTAWDMPHNEKMKFLEAHIGNVKKIYFAGGEPLMMAEHVEILELLIKHNRTDVMLSYNSNLSTLFYKKYDILNDFWIKFRKVKINVSIDGVAERAEYIRHGTKWPDFDNNIRRLLDARISGKFDFRFHITVSKLNVFYLNEIIEYMIQLGLIRNISNIEKLPKKVYIRFVLRPEYHCISHLPEDTKELVRENFAAFNKKHQTKFNWFERVEAILNVPSEQKFIDQFWSVTDGLDKIRNEDISKVLPKLKRHP